MKRTVQLIVFVVLWALLTSFVVAHTTYSVSLKMSAQNWDSDMWGIKETTPDRGLIVQLTILNSHESLPLRISSVIFKFALSYEGQPSGGVSYPGEIPYVLVPAKQSFIWYYAVLPPSSQLGDWKLSVSYTLTGLQWFDNTGMIPLQNSQLAGNLEPFPLDFKVVSESQLQQDIQQFKQRGMNINININEPIVQISLGGGGIVAIAIAVAFSRRRR